MRTEEEIREKIQYELGFNNGHIYGAGSSLVQSEQWVKALQWVLNEEE